MSKPKTMHFQDTIRRLAAIDLRSLAAFRVGLGVVLLWDLATSLGSVSAFYSNEGFLPLSALDNFRESPWLWSIHTWSGSTAWQTSLILLHIAAAACLLAGYRAQVAVFVCWALLCSIQVRNPTVLHSGDAAVRLLCFWAIFLPIGARWSLDEWRGRISVFSQSGHVSTFFSIGILIQVGLIYWMGAVLKNGDEWLRDGTAVYYALSLDQFVTATGRNLLQFPKLCRALTFGTWWFEIIGPILVFMPYRTGFWRVLVVAAFCCLHLALWICLRLGPFALTMISAWALFLPAEFWDAVAKRFRRASLVTAVPAIDSGNQCWMRHPVAQGFGFLCLLYVILWNLRGAKIKHSEKWFPQWINPPGYALHLQQYWTMFAPRPPTDDGWVIMEAMLANGTRVDLLRNGRAVSFDKPALISAEFHNSKWQKAILNLWSPQFQHLRPTFGNHMAFRWNGSNSSAEQIRGWTLWYMREDTLPNGHTSKPERIALLKTGQL